MANILITGTNRGLGLSLTAACARSGWTVFAGFHQGVSAELAELAASSEGRVIPVMMDVSSDASVADGFAAIRAVTDTLDRVINNAGILGDMEEGLHVIPDTGKMLAVYNTNTLGPLRVCHHALPMLSTGDERYVINISSEAGSIANCSRTGWFGYCLSKSAANQLTAMVHNNLRPLGGRAMAIHPGWIQSFMRGEVDAAADLTPDEAAAAVLKVVEDHKNHEGDKPLYLDWLGRSLPW